LLEAETSLAEKEYDIFLDIREKVLETFSDVKTLSDRVAIMDFTSTNSFNAYRNNYSKPII
jgi:DNA mismatch repair ATPase MutS